MMEADPSMIDPAGADPLEVDPLAAVEADPLAVDSNLPAVVEAPVKKRRRRKEPDPPKRKAPPRIGDANYQRLLLAKKRKLEALKWLQQYQKQNRLQYFNSGKALVNGKFLRANPKQQMILDAWNNQQYRTFVYVGGNRCLAGDTLIYDPVANVSKPISEIDSNFHVLAWDGKQLVPAFAFQPFAKEAEQLYRVTLEDGHSFVASGGHSVLTPHGYVPVCEHQPGHFLTKPLRVCDDLLEHSLSKQAPVSGFYQSIHPANVPNWIGTTSGSQSGCPAYSGFYDEQLRPVLSNDQGAFPLQGGAPRHTACSTTPWGGTGSTRAYNRDGLIGHLSNLNYLDPMAEERFLSCAVYTHCELTVQGPLTYELPNAGIARRLQSTGACLPQASLGETETLCGAFHKYPTQSVRSNVTAPQSTDLCGAHFQSTYVPDQPANHVLSHQPPNHVVRIISITPEKVDVKWDLHVPLYNNYYAAGVVHQNSGKTTLGVIISLSVLFGEWLWSDFMKPIPIQFTHSNPRKVRVVSQDWESGVNRVIIPELKKWWPQIRPYTNKKNNMGAESWWVDTKSGSTLEIMTGNQDPMLHEGNYTDLVWFDEPISHAHYIANARGLVDRQGRELFTMTLLTQPWIDREIIKRTLIDPVTRRDTGKPDPSVFVVETATTDNVGFGLTMDGLNQFAAKLTDDEYEIRIKGVPQYKKGLVYPAFKRELHVKPRFRVPLDWPVDIAIDTHPRKPHSVLFMATSPRGMKYCCIEIRMHGNGKTLADEIVRIVKWGVYRVNKVIIDPLSKGDSNDPAGSTYDEIYEVLARYGMSLETASKNKDAGILIVKEYLMSENGEPSLFFFDDLVYTIRETEGLMWHREDEKEIVQKEEDDMPECLYRLMLLETEYTPPQEDGAVEHYGQETVNETTGY